jgi:hypothetical protein
MRTFKIEQMSTASVAQVGAFYKQTFEQSGLTIASVTVTQDRMYALEARTMDRMHVVYLDVHGQPNGTKIVLMDHYSWPRP